LLSDFGWCNAALPAAEEAAALYSELAGQHPDAFQHDLAGALHTLGTILSDLGRSEAAWEAIEKARAQNPFTTLESNKAQLDATLFEINRVSNFRLLALDINGTSFFADFTWNLAPTINILLGRNGYGKSYILHAIAALLASDYRAMADLFPANEGEQRIGLTLDYQRHILATALEGSSRLDAGVRQTRLEFQNVATKTRQGTAGLRSRIGPVPLLAIPDLRFIDQSNLAIGAGAMEFSDALRSCTIHFLRNQPIVGLIHNTLYQLCLDYLEYGTLKLPGIQLLERVITRLSGAEFTVQKIQRSQSTAQFEIQVISEGLGHRPMPLQRASQGTLSTVAMLVLIERFLRTLIPNTPPEEDVCARSALVIIDELDAHLHPSWQRIIVPVLRETFPHVQFIVSVHSPLVISECLESEVAVLRKIESEQRFLIESDPSLIGEDLQAIIRRVFETDPTSSTLDKYLTLLGNRSRLENSIAYLRGKEALTSEEETELCQAEIELTRLNRAQHTRQQQMQIEDLEEYEISLKARVTRLEAEVARLEARAKELGK